MMWRACFMMLTILGCVMTCRADTHYVSAAGSHSSPYTNWSAAAHDIQSAVDACVNGDVVLVTNGTFNTGGAAINGSLTNRVAITNGITVRSLYGPTSTFIVGQGPLGPNAIRCVWLATNAVLDGFTLTSGHTLAEGSSDDLSGAGVWCANGMGVITNCIITACTAYYMGGGFNMGTLLATVVSNNTAMFGGGGQGGYNGLIDRCTIVDNHAMKDGGGLYSGAILRNSFFAGNSAGQRGGGAYGVWNIESCTIVGNSAEEGGGINASSVANSIVYYNTDQGGFPNHADGYITYSCTTPDTGGAGNITNTPGLVGLWNAHLVTNSPCIEAGTNSAWMAVVADIDGEPRLSGRVDMGCDEVFYPGGYTASIGSSILVDATNAVVSVPIRFTSNIRGQARMYRWDWGDGSIQSNECVVDHAYAAAGTYSVTQTAWNAIGSITATRTVRIYNNFTNYVSTNGVPVSPFTNWANASATIQGAIDACPKGGTVRVMDGTYQAGGANYFSSNRVVVGKSLIVQSVNGANKTIIQGVPFTDARAMRPAYVSAGARLIGFQLAGGRSRGPNSSVWSFGEFCGGGLYSEAGSWIADCIVINNGATHGGGVYGWGTLTNCTVMDNSAAEQGGGVYGSILKNCVVGPDNEAKYGAGVMGVVADTCVVSGNRASETGGGCQDSTLRRSLIEDNTAMDSDGNYGYGGGANSCVLSNCLIFFNTAAVDGGGVQNSTLRNCTVRGNQANLGHGGGAYASTICDSIVYYNYADSYSSSANVYFSGSGDLNYSCTTPEQGIGTGNITDNPQFVSFDGWPADYHLASNSPCIDRGDPTSTVTNDYDAVRRPVDGNSDGTYRVDMGAYEFEPATLDSDSDGMPNVWERLYGLDSYTSNGGADADGDTLTNLREYQIGTSPVFSNSPPTASAVKVTVMRNRAKTVYMQGQDPNGLALTYTLSSAVTTGTVSGVTSNHVLYTPPSNYMGSAQFMYRVQDAAFTSTSAAVDIEVRAPKVPWDLLLMQ